jgi:hypothetical protein
MIAITIFMMSPPISSRARTSTYLYESAPERANAMTRLLVANQKLCQSAARSFFRAVPQKNLEFTFVRSKLIKALAIFLSRRQKLHKY